MLDLHSEPPPPALSVAKLGHLEGIILFLHGIILFLHVVRLFGCVSHRGQLFLLGNHHSPAASSRRGTGFEKYSGYFPVETSWKTQRGKIPQAAEMVTQPKMRWRNHGECGEQDLRHLKGSGAFCSVSCTIPAAGTSLGRDWGMEREAILCILCFNSSEMWSSKTTLGLFCQICAVVGFSVWGSL